MLKSKYGTDKTELEKKTPDVSNLIKKTKLTELENKIPDISNLAAKTALTSVENKIPSVSSLVKKTDYNTKVTEIENKLDNHNHYKYIDAPEFNKLAADVFDARLAQANLIIKTDFDTKLSSLNRKITQNTKKHLLAENELKKIKTFDSDYFIGKGHFEEDGTQNYLVFQPLNKYFKVIANTDYVLSWKSKGLSTESIKPPTTSDNSLTLVLNYYGNKIRAKFTGSCLKQPNISYTYGKVVNIYIVYELNKIYTKTTPTLVNCLFGEVSLTKNTDIDKCKYFGYGIGFDRRGLYLLPNGTFGKNVIILE